ncbi:HNH endonuclease [Rugamonas rubra]|uniref:HNH endonuclease n=1 Tax=Rugamonas rubra TaxID=758825 RepID=A0A1I4SK44_9BURK|nr:HNH endonuclease [Rugamonas rubra]SFM64805.1 HNH endonuclease [Rugamonas rubra]
MFLTKDEISDLTGRVHPAISAVLRRLYWDEKLSSIDIARAVGVAPSTVCKWMARAGIERRTAGEGSQNAAWKNRGKKREITPEWRANLSAAGRRWGAANAKGTRITPSGYVEYTTGPNKGRSVHRVVMEQRLGRPLASYEVIRFKDQDRGNYELDNLQLMTRAELAAYCRAQEMECGSGCSKINFQQAAKIRRLFLAGDITRRILSERFGISSKQIASILRGEAWVQRSTCGSDRRT